MKFALSQARLVLAALALISALCGSVRAQVEAHVASVTGRVMRQSASRPAQILKRGETLAPNDEIDTRGGGRVAIALSDGSLVTILPGSRVVFGDYRFAASPRELFGITIGRVRVRINHFSGKPNPYRVNSPTASIAVRGTEFSVAVSATGETQVVVYEGLVEVTSLTDPRRRAMVEPGRGVIVRANEELRFFRPNRANEIGDRNDGGGRNDDQSSNQQSGQPSPNPGNPADPANRGSQGARRDPTGNYERYLDSLVQPGETPPLSRFVAFADSHLDSLENPAYATEFAAAEGRVFLLPSFSGAVGGLGAERSQNLSALGSSSLRPVDYGMLLQTSLFAPLPSSRLVMGGSFTTDYGGLQSRGIEPGATSPRTTSSTTDSTSIAASVLLARRFGSPARTSIGLGLDHTAGRGSLLDLTTEAGAAGLVSRERLDARSSIRRTRLRVGLAHEFAAGPKFGIFYRHGFAASDDRERSHTRDGATLALDSDHASSRLSELGLRLRGPITKRWFYGAEGTLLSGSFAEQLRRAGAAEQNDRERFRQATLSFGLGYAPRPRTVFSLDVAGAVSHAKDLRRETAAGVLLDNERQRIKSLSAHAAFQSDVWRKLFVNASFLVLTQQRETSLLPPDAGFARDRVTGYFSDYGAGWRFTPNFLAQYVFSTSYGRNPAGHALLLRYTFNFGDK
ncbi:MAG: FecR family protein [Blastocatellia bacterium]